VSLPVLTAVTNATWEADLVAALDGSEHGVTIVRRCVDVADLLAAAASGTAKAAVLSADLRRLDREVLSRLSTAGVAVVGLVEPGDEDADRRLRQLGLLHVLPADAAPQLITEAIVVAASEAGAGGGHGLADPRKALPRLGDPPVEFPRLPGSGTLVAVWGPTGAPGRTTVAVGIADEAARLGVPALLVDADPYGGVIAQVLGLLDESPGLAAAVHLDNQGALDVPALAGLARGINPRLRVLTGIARADRWPELRPDSIRAVLDRARSLAAITVVDCGFNLEQDEELAYDTMAPRRNGATLAALEAADTVLAVGAADPIGVQRLVRGLADLAEVLPETTPRVIVNRLRSGVVPGDPAREVAAALRRFAGVKQVETLPYDQAALDRALASGRTLGEAVPNSTLRQALAGLASNLVGVAAPAAGRRGRRH
jgi:MinD-like ATPase involved in chromosome partitioning or flagellar assembly